MSNIFIFLVLLTNALAAMDERDVRTGKRTYSQAFPKQSYWDAEEEEKNAKRQKKFRTRQTAKGSGNTSRKPMNSRPTIEKGGEILTYSKTSVPKNDPQSQAEMKSQIRRPNFLS